MKKTAVLICSILALSISTHAFEDDDNNTNWNSTLEGSGTEENAIDGQSVPLDESAGMFAGAIVAMGAYILYRKRKQASQNK